MADAGRRQRVRDRRQQRVRDDQADRADPAETPSTIRGSSASEPCVRPSSPRVRRTEVGGVQAGGDHRQQPRGVLDHLAGDPEAPRSAPRRARRACPGAPARRPTTGVAHGVVAWARSPSTVVEPVEQRRPTARSIIGERSCASSAPRDPATGSARPGRPPRRSAPRPRRTTRADPGARCGLSQRSSACSSASSTPSATLGEEVRVREQPQHQPCRVDRGPHLRRRTASPRGCGRPRPAPGRRGSPRRSPSGPGPRAPAAARASPRAAPYRTPRSRSSVTDLLHLVRRDPPASCAARHHAAPSAGVRTPRPHAPGADDRGHPGVALEHGDGWPSAPRTAYFAFSRASVAPTSSSIVVCCASISPSAGSTSPM